MTDIRIAVASQDGVVISSQLGLSRVFLVFEVHSGQVNFIENRIPIQLMEDHPHRPEKNPGNSIIDNHYQLLIQLLEDCKTLICGDMDSSAAEEFKVGGIAPMISADISLTAEQAVQRLLDGQLTIQPHSVCCRRHDQQTVTGDSAL